MTYDVIFTYRAHSLDPAAAPIRQRVTVSAKTEAEALAEAELREKYPPRRLTVEVEQSNRWSVRQPGGELNRARYIEQGGFDHIDETFATKAQAREYALAHGSSPSDVVDRLTALFPYEAYNGNEIVARDWSSRTLSMSYDRVRTAQHA